MIGLPLTDAEEAQIALDLEGTICSDECLAEIYPRREVAEVLDAAAKQGVFRCEDCSFWTRNVNQRGECQCLDCQES